MTTWNRIRLLLLAGMIGVGGLELGRQLSIPGFHGFIISAEAVVGRPLTPVSVAGVPGAHPGDARLASTTARLQRYRSAAGRRRPSGGTNCRTPAHARSRCAAWCVPWAGRHRSCACGAVEWSCFAEKGSPPPTV